MSYDRDVELATSSRDGTSDWEKIIGFCNRVSNSIGSTAMQLAITAIFKRIKTSSDYRVQLQAITLLESCAGNCGKLFQTELASQQSLVEIRSIITSSQYSSEVVARMKEVLASWTAEFQHETNFAPIRQLYDSLRKEGVSFITQGQSSSSQLPAAQGTAEDDIARAIRLSLEEANKLKSSSSGSNSGSNAASMYPLLSTTSQPAKTTPTKGRVRAIYDFDAAEDNELSFKAGELIELIDDSDQNWWKGRTSLGTGLFPANFVSKNLQRDPEPVVKATTDKQKTAKKEKVTAVSVEKIDLCLEMLKSADATDLNQGESETTKELEEECQQMRPLVLDKIKELDKQEELMEEVSQMYHEAMTTYKRLLMENAYKPTPTPVASQTVSNPSGGNYGNQPVASGNQYSSLAFPSAYGQQPEMSSVNVRYSPELPRAHFPATGLPQQQQQPLPQAPPTQSVNSIQLAPPAYQAPLQNYNPPGTGNYQAPPSYQSYPMQNIYTSTPLL